MAVRITQHIRYGLTLLPFGTFCCCKTSYMLGTLYALPSLRKEEVDHE